MSQTLTSAPAPSLTPDRSPYSTLGAIWTDRHQAAPKPITRVERARLSMDFPDEEFHGGEPGLQELLWFAGSCACCAVFWVVAAYAFFTPDARIARYLIALYFAGILTLWLATKTCRRCMKGGR